MQMKYIISTDTTNFGLDEVIDILKECYDILRELGYEEEIPRSWSARISKRSVKSLGCCTKNRSLNTCEIMVAQALLNYNNAESLYNTLMHEAIHSLEGCSNHGEKWHRIGKEVTKAYPQIGNITTYNEDKGYSKFIAESDRGYKYSVTCDKCGYVFRYKKLSAEKKEHILRGWCGCGNCHNKTFTIKQLY